MLKFRNVFFWTFVVLALAGGCYAYFTIKESKRPGLEAIAVLPDSCSLYLSTNDLFELNRKIGSQSLIADKLKLFSDIGMICRHLHRFDSLISSSEILSGELEDNPVHMAIYGRNSDWLAAFNLKQLGNQDVFSEAMLKLFNAQKGNDGFFSFILEEAPVHCKLKDGVVLLSGSEKLLGKAFDRSGAKFHNSRSYRDFKATLAEDGLLSVFVNHGLYANSRIRSRLNLNILYGKGCSAGQIELEPSGLKINGFAQPDSAEIISALSNQPAQPLAEILSILPANMTGFKSYGFESYRALRGKLIATESESCRDFWREANEAAMYNLRAEFEANTGNHLLGFQTSVAGQEYIAVEVNDTARCHEHLRLMSDTFTVQNGLRIFHLKHPNNIPRLFFPFFDGGAAMAAVFNSFVIFSQNKEDLLSLLVDLGSGRTALSRESFNYYRGQNFPDEYNFLFYTSPSLNRGGVKSFFNYPLPAGKDPYENLRHFSFSLTNGESAFKFRLQLLNEAESNVQEQNVLWTLNLDTTASMAPSGFVNHTTGEKEVVVQDDAGTLYLVNAKGNVLWKRQLGEKVMSAIHMIDAFKNNKFQMLFNTGKKIYLIDRNGKDVKGFPIVLPASATSQIGLLDYDNDKDYRLFIACANGNIYNYNSLGQSQEGFTPVKTEHEVVLPVQYVRVGKSDYITALDREGRIYTFGRKGQARIGLKNRSLAGCHAFYVDATNDLSTTNLVCLDDKSGLINKISFSDKKDLLKLSMEQGNAAVKFRLVDDNRDMDMVITSGSSVMAFNFNGDLLFEKNLGTALESSDYYGDESHSLYCALNSEKNEVLLFDQLKQKTRRINAVALPLIYDLFNDNKKYAIVTNGNQLSCLLID